MKLASEEKTTPGKTQNSPRVVELLRQALPPLLEGTPIEAAYLYGSVATGMATPTSDIDIALLAGFNVSPRERLQLELRLEQELADRLHLLNADVRILNGAPLRFQGRVLTQAIVLYSRDEAYQVEWESRVRSAYFDYLPVMRQMREAFFERLKEDGLYG